MTHYDLAVIGTGPGGYVCAIRAAQLGLSVAVIEKRPTPGGTCLNVGCIPSKALLHASERFAEAAHGFAAMGIAVEPRLDLAAMMAYKDEGVRGNVQGVEFLLKKNKVTTFRGVGRLAAPGAITVTAEDGSSQLVAARAIVIATGSEVMSLPGVSIDERRILSSTGALELSQVPPRLLVVGGGVIGLELGSVWRRLGSQVTVVEFLDRILPGADAETARQFQRILTKQGVAFRLGSRVTGVTEAGDALSVAIAPAAGGESAAIAADAVLVAIGRIPYTEGLGLDVLGVTRDSRGRIAVDARFQTNVPGIYAIGDVIAGPMLAHKAQDEGVAVAEILAGQAGQVNYAVIPSVVYTAPEVAWVGQTEEELKAAGVAYAAGKFPFTANGRAKVMRAVEGFVKILADARSDRVLGVHIVGPDAGALIAEAATLMEFGGAAEDLARICHAHPTLSEAVREAALAVAGRALHM